MAGIVGPAAGNSFNRQSKLGNPSMLTYVVRRLLLMIPTLLGITLLVFSVMAAAPGGLGGTVLSDAEGQMQGEEARRVREYYQKRYGLDQPAPVQYVRWLNRISPIGFRYDADGNRGAFGVKWPDLGESIARKRPVGDLLREALPVTIMLNLICVPLIYGVGIASGIISARNRGSLLDVGSSTVQLAAWSIPTIWAGVMMIGFLANRQYVKLFPTSGLHGTLSSAMPFLPRLTDAGFQHGYLLDTMWHMVLPVLCLTYGASAFLTKLTRGSILENLNADYVRTARAKGLTENVVMYRHVFANSTLALITVASGIIPSLLGGSVIVETIFSIPGMGKLGVEAVQFRDRELVLAVTFIGGLIGLLCEILRDICYALADPRVSYE
jgi:peptide/nickel transport system permease protein